LPYKEKRPSSKKKAAVEEGQDAWRCGMKERRHLRPSRGKGKKDRGGGNRKKQEGKRVTGMKKKV